MSYLICPKERLIPTHCAMLVTCNRHVFWLNSAWVNALIKYSECSPSSRAGAPVSHSPHKTHPITHQKHAFALTFAYLNSGTFKGLLVLTRNHLLPPQPFLTPPTRHLSKATLHQWFIQAYGSSPPARQWTPRTRYTLSLCFPRGPACVLGIVYPVVQFSSLKFLRRPSHITSSEHLHIRWINYLVIEKEWGRAEWSSLMGDRWKPLQPLG